VMKQRDGAGGSVAPHEAEFLFYAGPDGKLNIEVFYADETIWLSQAKMAELFGVDRTVITKHLANIFQSGELDESSNVQKVHIAHSAKPVSYYNLDVIISVGYRVNSQQATRFRQWATQTLRGYMIKGFVLDDERLKNGTHFGKDYFDELLERIREIRASERRFYQKITDIYATSADYDPRSEITQEFYATVQNKLHFAIHGQTAAELIASRTSAKKPHMGLTTWRHTPSGKVLKSDVDTAKNYLSEKELRQLNRIVTMYLDFAENQAERNRPMNMSDWAARLNAFLQFNEMEILQNQGKITAAAAKKLAEKEFENFRVIQDRIFESDFDQQAKRLTDKPKEEGT
jgi:hypothetical protein